MTGKVCGNCKCYTPLQIHAETGRCRKYNTTVQLRTKCIHNTYWKCKCMNKKQCIAYLKYKKRIENE